MKRFTLPTLALAALLLLLPVTASAKTFEPTGLLSWAPTAWDALAGLFGVSVNKNGAMSDPDGAPSEAGATYDPDGVSSEIGAEYGPDGVATENGATSDPDGAP